MTCPLTSHSTDTPGTPACGSKRVLGKASPPETIYDVLRASFCETGRHEECPYWPERAETYQEARR